MNALNLVEGTNMKREAKQAHSIPTYPPQTPLPSLSVSPDSSSGKNPPISRSLPTAKPSNHNVWEARLQQRKKPTATSPPALSPPAGSMSNVTESRSLSPPGMVHEPGTDISLDVVPDPSLDDGSDDAWLRRIHMLNGGESKARFGSFPPQYTHEKPDPLRRHERHGSKLEDEAEPFLLDEESVSSSASVSEAYTSSSGWVHPWMYQPDQQRSADQKEENFSPTSIRFGLTKSDGSFSPHRPSAHGPGAYGPRPPMPPMGFIPLMPMADRGESTSTGKNASSDTHSSYTSVHLNSHPMMPGPSFPYMVVPSMPVPIPGNGSAWDSAHPPHQFSRTPSKTENDRDETRSEESREDVEERQAPNEWNGPPTPMVMPSGPQGMPMPYMVPMQSIMPIHLDPQGRPMFPVYAPFGMSLPTNMMASHDSSTVSHQLRSQTEYYFSDANLQSDYYLRQKMDKSGYVELQTLLEFKRIGAILHQMPMTKGENNEPLKAKMVDMLRSALESSQLLELDDAKTSVRRKERWQTFVIGK